MPKGERPFPGKPSRFLPGEHVILRGQVTRVGEDERGNEMVTVLVSGLAYPVTLDVEKVEKVEKG